METKCEGDFVAEQRNFRVFAGIGRIGVKVKTADGRQFRTAQAYFVSRHSIP